MNLDIFGDFLFRQVGNELISINDVLYHNNNVSSHITLRSNNNHRLGFDYILKSEPGHGIDSLVTIFYVAERLTFDHIYDVNGNGRFFEQNVLVPGSDDGGFIRYEIRLNVR